MPRRTETGNAMGTTRIAVIMAGGIGERFWPLSRRLRPKQLLPLGDDGCSLLAEAVARLAPLIPPERILVVTGQALVAPIRAAGVGVPPENVIAEPCKRNTAGCLLYAAAVARQRFGEAGEVTLAIATADHLIGDAARFRAVAAAALDAAEREPALVTIGIRPARPDTGYGYIELDAPPGAAAATGPVSVRPVLRFREKPDATAAAEFLRNGRFLWNSGMFFWRLSVYLDELAAANPAMAVTAGDVAAALRAGDAAAATAAFAQLPDISIDYALLEKARRVLVVVGDFPWDDLGAWDAYARRLPSDSAGNATVGDPILLDARDCLVYNAAGAPRMAVAVAGIEGLAVVVTEDAVLVLPRDRAQDVRALLAELRRRNAPQL